MAKSQSPLDHVKVASPCPADWNQMTGNDQVRFCSQCNLNVYNLSGMTRDEAEHLLTSTEGRLCIRYYKRKDGTVITKDCPVGLRAFKLKVVKVAGAALSAVLSFCAGLGLYRLTSASNWLDYIYPDTKILDERVAIECKLNQYENIENDIRGRYIRDEREVLGMNVQPIKKESTKHNSSDKTLIGATTIVKVEVEYDETGRVIKATTLWPYRCTVPHAASIARRKRFPPGKAGKAIVSIPIG
jgi:hypothetical protein